MTSLLVLFLLATGAVHAVPVSHKRTLHNVDYVVSGVAGVGGGTGTISVTGVSGTVTQAFLYWHGINNTDASAVYDNATVTINANSVTGVSLGDASTNCWGAGSSRAFEADVTTFVTGNGDYVIDGLSSCGGCNANGASLVVIFNDGNASNNRDLVFLTGNDSNYPEGFPGEYQGWHAVLPSMTYNGGQVKAIFHLADGQNFPDDLVTFTTNSSSLAISDTDMLWDGNSLPSAGTSRAGDGDLWDIHTLDITAAFGTTGTTRLNLDGQDNAGDCLGLVAVLLDMPPGTAPEPPVPGSCVIAPPGMVAWYPGDANANDIQGNNNGTLQGGVTFATGKVDQAFSFDGTDGVVAIPDSPTFKITKDLTIDAWININQPPSGGFAQILFRGDNNGHNPYYLAVGYGGDEVFLHIQDSNGDVAEVASLLAQGEWVHVAATLEDATGDMKLYINGSLAAQGNAGTVRPFADLDPAYSPGLGIGNRQGGSDVSEPFNGLIDEVEVFNRALLASDIGSIFDAGSVGKCKLNPTSVVSRKTHGTGTFDINLSLTGTRGVECRSGGANGNYTMVFTFVNNVTSVASASVTSHNPMSGTGTVQSSSPGPNPNQYTVNLTNVSSRQYLIVTLNSVLDAEGNSGNVIGPQMGVLVGDTTADGTVNSADISQTKSQSGHGVTISNFREDVTADGSINSADISLVKSKSGTALP